MFRVAFATSAAEGATSSELLFQATIVEKGDWMEPTAVARMAGKTGASIPAWLAKAYEGLDDDVETRRIVATAVLADQVALLRARGFDDFHFYTLNQANLTYAACRILGIAPKDPT
jgi:hypothetical protein